MITPYLIFNGSCKDALNFYRTVFHSDEPKVLPYGDYMPEGSKTPPELLRTWVMHAEMEICGTKVWFADESKPPKNGDNIKLTATASTGKEASAIFDALSEGGELTLPPTETFYSVFHAAVTDKFGVNWNVVAEEAPKQVERKRVNNERVYKMKFSDVYPLYIQKALRKGRTKAEVDTVIEWLTGYDEQGLQSQIDKEADFEAFFAEAPQINANASKITGVICGVRVEEIEEPLIQKVRWLDKLVDELAKGKPMQKVLRNI